MLRVNYSENSAESSLGNQECEITKNKSSKRMCMHACACVRVRVRVRVCVCVCVKVGASANAESL